MKKCLVCGKELKEKRRKYRSLTCHRSVPSVLKGRQTKEYKQKKCKFCGKSLTRQQLKQNNHYCSSKCSNGIRKKTKTKLICKNCGKIFIPKAKDRVTFCSRDCAFEYKTANKKQKPKWVETTYEKKCVVCGADFQTIYKTQKYCSEKCAHRGVKKDKKEYSKICSECGLAFKTQHHSTAYCSEECRRKHNNRYGEIRRRHKIRENGKVDYSINLQALIKRKGLRCSLCGCNVNMSAHTNSVDYGSVDHVIPISKGGTHTWNNVQLAHRKCNSAKGADSVIKIYNGQYELCV